MTDQEMANMVMPLFIDTAKMFGQLGIGAIEYPIVHDRFHWFAEARLMRGLDRNRTCF